MENVRNYFVCTFFLLLLSSTLFSQKDSGSKRAYDYIPSDSILIDKLNSSLQSGFESVKQLDSVPILNIQSETQFQETLNELHIRQYNFAMYLTDKSNFNFRKQNGLAYTWGAKEYKKRTSPAKYKKQLKICRKKMHGLDCSGFVYQVMLNSGVNFGAKPRNFANANFFWDSRNWTEPSHGQNGIKPIQNYFNCDTCFKILKIENANIDQIQSGDIIVFYNSIKAYHIGICFLSLDDKNNQTMTLFESRGKPNVPCSYNSKRGPVRTSISPGRLSKIKFGIIRVVEN